jgi:hypothetical protein
MSADSPNVSFETDTETQKGVVRTEQGIRLVLSGDEKE